MAENFEIRYYKPGDEEGIISLLKLSFTEWNNRVDPLNYWNWKYKSPPLDSIIAVAETGGRIVAVDHSLILRFKLGSDTVLSSLSDDVATHPSYRGRGLSKLLDDLSMQRIEGLGTKFQYSVPIHPAFARIRRPKEFFMPHKITHLVKIVDTEAYLKVRDVKNLTLARAGFTLLRVMGNIRALFSKKLNVGDDLRIIEVKSFDEDINKIWEATSSGLNFALEKRTPFLNWRYCDSRGGDFIVHQLYDSVGLVGYAVAEIRKNSYAVESYILDLQTLPGRADAAQVLAKSLVNKLLARGINTIHLWAVDGHPHLKMMKSLGFITLFWQSPLVLKITLFGIPMTFYEMIQKSTPTQIHFGYGDYL